MVSAAEETVEAFLQKLHKVIKEKNLIPEQIYNAHILHFYIFLLLFPH